MKRSRLILFSLLLASPVMLFLIHHYYYHSPELIPTGFTVDENVLYMSYAHQYVDNSHFSFFYSNPFDGDPQSPKIYFQPINFVFAAAIKAGIDPGLCFSLFGLLMAVLCIYTGARIIEQILPGNQHRLLIITLFTWGSGLTAVAGLIGSSILKGHHYTSWLDGIFLADPANGWWGLNWGRNLFIPLEALYHFLFLLNIYLLLKKKAALSVLTALLLSISHPFTGSELLLIINTWLFFEKIICKNKNIPGWYWPSIIIITILHAWYYLIYLSNFPEHRLLLSQYSVGWTYSLLIALAAYSLVTLFSALTFKLLKPLKHLFSFPHQRLFMCWAVVAFLLSKHEWFIKPMQPIHFTRGYVWAGLFLFSIPALKYLIDYFRNRNGKKIILTGFIVLFLSDNLLWISNILRKKENVEWEGHITNDTREVLNFLSKNATPNTLLIGNAPLISYMANVYSSANSWVSHPYNTPNKNSRADTMQKFFETAIRPKEWDKRDVWIVINKKESSLRMAGIKTTGKIFENETYEIFTP